MATVVPPGSGSLARNLSRKLLPLVLCATTLGGCYGPFNLTRRVHHWNGHFHENKWPHEGMFLLLTILPVYGFTLSLDLFILNSIEFWFNVNPILPAEDVDEITQTFTNSHQTMVFKRETRDGTPAVLVRLYDADGLVDELVMTTEVGGSTVVRDADGLIVGEARTRADGTLVLIDGNGVVRTFPADDRLVVSFQEREG